MPCDSPTPTNDAMAWAIGPGVTCTASEPALYPEAVIASSSRFGLVAHACGRRFTRTWVMRCERAMRRATSVGFGAAPDGPR